MDCAGDGGEWAGKSKRWRGIAGRGLDSGEGGAGVRAAAAAWAAGNQPDAISILDTAAFFRTNTRLVNPTAHFGMN